MYTNHTELFKPGPLELLAEIIRFFIEMLLYRDNVHYFAREDGKYTCHKGSVDIEELVRSHLLGKKTIGTPLLSLDSKVKVIVWDIDADDPDKAFPVLKQLLLFLYDLGLHPVPAVSGGKGYHVWLFLTPVPGADAKRFGELVASQIPVSGSVSIETFPKQAELTEECRIGNFVKWFLGRHPTTGNWCALLDKELNIIPWEGVAEHLSKIEPIALPDIPETPDDARKPTTDEVINEGKRNITIFKQACWLLESYQSRDEAHDRLRGWNREKCNPPLPEKEIDSTFASAVKIVGDRAGSKAKGRGGSGNQKESMATQLVKLAMGDATFFCNQFGDPYVRFPVEGHMETWPVSSQFFQQWLSLQLWDDEEKAISKETVKSACNTMSAHARFHGRRHELSLRFAQGRGKICVDLCNPGWEVIELGADGFRIFQPDYPMFCRYPHQLQYPIPTDMELKEAQEVYRQLLDLVNIDEDRDHRLLFLVWVLAAFVARTPRPILVIHGSEGTGKSSCFRILRGLIDPSKMRTVSFPSDMKELVQLLSHHALIPFDNISQISDRFSDILCRAITGESTSKRKLFTDDDDIYYQYQRAIALNGIDFLTERADLVDRCIFIELEPIPEAARRTEAELDQEYEKLRPKLFSAMLRLICEAIRIYPTVHLDASPRMADFAVWGVAFARALGYDEGAFLGAYSRNIMSGTEESIEADLVATTVRALGDWRGTPTALREVLESQALLELGYDYENRPRNWPPKDWPSTPSALSKKLKRITASLAKVGVMIEFHRTKSKRIIQIHTDADASVTGVTPSSDDENGGDAKLEEFDAACHPDDLVSPSSSTMGDTSDGSDGASLDEVRLELMKDLKSTGLTLEEVETRFGVSGIKLVERWDLEGKVSQLPRSDRWVWSK